MLDQVPPILRRTFRLHSYEVDRTGEARPDVLLSFMLDAAWAHANYSEFSYDALREEGQLWVLSRFLAIFHKFPRWDDQVTIETWSKGVDKLFGLRDFAIYSQSNSKLISATSAWLIIDRRTMRIQRLDLAGGKFPSEVDKHEIDTKLEKIESIESERTGFEQMVRFSDIDVNSHVNSSRYVKWILDSFPLNHLEEKQLKSFEINYLAEAQVGDRVFVSSADAGEYHYCEVSREKDGVDLCRAKVEWG